MASHATGGHATGGSNIDSLGPVNLGEERSSRNKKEAADTLRWDTQRRDNPDSKAAEARQRIAHAEAAAKVGLQWPDEGGRSDQVSRVHAPNRRHIVGMLRRNDDIPLPPQRSAPAKLTDNGGQPAAQSEYRSSAGQKLEMMRQMRALSTAELDAAAGTGMPMPKSGNAPTPGLADAMKDPRVAAALNAALNAPNRLAAEHFKGRNVNRH